MNIQYLSCTRSGFPSGNEVPPAFYTAGEAWEENEPGKWIVGSGWNDYRPSGYSAGGCFYVDPGLPAMAVLDKPVIGNALQFTIGGNVSLSLDVQVRTWTSDGSTSWQTLATVASTGPVTASVPLPNPNFYYQVRITNTPGSGVFTILDLTQVV